VKYSSFSKKHPFLRFALFFLALIGVGFASAVFFVALSQQSFDFHEHFADYPTQRLVIGGQEINVYVADTLERRQQGLSDTQYIPQDWGLLFSFAEPGQRLFWMKDMNYAIDIIWLDANFVPVDIERSVSPDSYPATFGHGVLAQYVLETAPGIIELVDGE
jgi:uncharacterized membrane protein (UPF0127 family)